jgi:putative methionine-R-sulfoxide reductase with GAF domain
MWSLAALIFGLSNGIGEYFDWSAFAQVLLGVLIGGVITSALQFFTFEHYWRTELPLFFPEGGMVDVPAFRMTVRRRMLILFILVSEPLLELAILNAMQATQMANSQNPVLLLPRILVLQVFLAGAGFLAAIILARTLGFSLVLPLEKLSQRMRSVADGNLDERADVTSNDEIGMLADHFNHMIASLQERDTELRTVYQISREITASLELEQTLQSVLERVRQMIDYDGAEICIYDRNAGVLVSQAWFGTQGMVTDTRGRVYQLGKGYTGWIGENLQSLLVEDVAAYPSQQPVARQLADNLSLESYLGVPLLFGQMLVGTLELVSTHKDAFDEHDRQLLETIAPQAAVAIQNAIEVQERERNLKAQIEKLRIEIDQAKRTRQVKAITQSEYFRELQETAKQLRQNIKGATPDDEG